LPRRERLTDGGVSRGDRRLAELMRPVVWCGDSDQVRDVADQIGLAGTSCALVRTAAGLGIVTDYDFRHRVATGQVGIDAPIAQLATVPALTIEDDATQAGGLLRMVEHGVHHLVVTDQSGRPVGVVRVVDLAQAEVRDPLLVRAAIEGAASLDELSQAARLLPTTIVELCDNGYPPPTSAHYTLRWSMPSCGGCWTCTRVRSWPQCRIPGCCSAPWRGVNRFRCRTSTPP
jgi:CBS domain-containing protein